MRRAPGALCLMVPLASVGPREVSGFPKVGSQPQGSGTICPSRITLISSPQMRIHALVLFLSCLWPHQKFFRDTKSWSCSEIPPFSYSQQVAPRSGHSPWWEHKAPRMVWGEGFESWFYHLLCLPVWFLASLNLLSFKFLICKMEPAKSLKLIGRNKLLDVYNGWHIVNA